MSQKTPYNVVGVTFDHEQDFKGVGRGKPGAISKAKKILRDNPDEYRMVLVLGERRQEVGRATKEGGGKVVWKRNKEYIGR